MANIANRAYAAAHFALELDGKDEVGLFRSLEGGGVKADVMSYQFGANPDTKDFTRFRQLGKPKFEDIKLQVGMSMSEAFYKWVTEFVAGKGTRKNGAVVAADFYYNERARRNFKEAMIKEMTFPKLDAQDKNAVYMGVTLAVEDIEFVKGTGKKLDVPKGFDAQKLWSANNFSFTLDDGKLKEACNRVTKIDAFTIKQNTAEYHAGGYKAAIKVATPIEFPNLTFYVPEADAQPFMEYMAKGVGFGNSGNGSVPKDRAISVLNGEIQTFDTQNHRLLSVHFKGADIVSITPDRSDATSEEVKQVKIELYTEKMEIDYPAMELE
ncbi:MAG TPA: phage tail protein [Kofleriaceae bacterium]|nr:phage tail protein [Kofleriaceae bacterium]